MALRTQLVHVGAGDVRGIVLNLIAAPVDGMMLGTTKLGTVNGNTSSNYGSTFSQGEMPYRFCPLIIDVTCIAASGTFTTPPTLSVGTNSPTYDNIAIGLLLTGVTTINNHTILPIRGGSPIAAYGTDIFCSVSIPATGLGATLTLDVSIIGGMSSDV